MKGMDLFCASPASTAICSSMDQRSTIRHGTRPLNHHHSHHLLHDQPRRTRAPVPCSSQLPLSPRPYPQKSRKSSSSKEVGDMRRKSSADITDLISTNRPPGSSSRYLLSDTPFFELLSDSSDHVSALVPTPVAITRRLSISSSDSSPKLKTSLSTRSRDLFPTQTARTPRLRISSSDGSPKLKTSLSTRSRDLVPTQVARTQRLSTSSSDGSPKLKTSLSTHSRDQVVVLRVSLHCKGCEGKVRKHILKMEGVRSFSIDFADKKVTIIGDVTPLGVLASVSRVKNAQLWPSPSSSSSSSPSPSPSPSLFPIHGQL